MINQPSKGRGLLQVILALALLIFSAVVCAVGLWIVMPKPPSYDLGPVSDYPPSVTPYRVGTDSGFYFVVNDGEAIIILSSRTPQYNCEVKWVPINNRFEDPCTGSKFTPTGEYIEGPAPHGLVSYGYEIEDGNLILTTWESSPASAPHGR